MTWEWIGDHAAVPDKVAAILNPRLSEERVRETVEFLFANASYTLSERLGYASNRRFNPYPARFGALTGIPWRGQVICGHNPWLFARKVDGVDVVENEDGDEVLVWSERPRPVAHRD